MAVSKDGGRIFVNSYKKVSGEYQYSLSEYDKAGNPLQTFTPAMSVADAEYGPDGAWYVIPSSNSANAVYRCAAGACAVWATAPIPAVNMSFSPDGAEVWFVEHGLNKPLKVFSVATAGGVSAIGAFVKDVATPVFPANDIAHEWRGVAVGKSGVYLAMLQLPGLYALRDGIWEKATMAGFSAFAATDIEVDAAESVYVHSLEGSYRLDYAGGAYAGYPITSEWDGAVGGPTFVSRGSADVIDVLDNPQAVKAGALAVALEREACKVTLNANGGSSANGPLEVATGTTVGSLPTPKRSGYSFLGWFTAAAGGTALDPASAINADAKLYAHWTKTAKKVTFNVNGGRKLAASTKSVSYGKAYGKLPKPKRTGWVFAGWTTTKNGSVVVTAKSVVAETANKITLYAKWRRVAKTITVSASGTGVKVSKLATVKVGKKGKVVISSKLVDSDKVDVTAAKFTVKKGSKTVAKNKASVTLGPGSYKVTTTASYKVATVTTIPEKTETTVIAKAGDSVPMDCGYTMGTSSGGAPATFTYYGFHCSSDQFAQEIAYASIKCKASWGVTQYLVGCDVAPEGLPSGTIYFDAKSATSGFIGGKGYYHPSADITGSVTTPASQTTNWSAVKTAAKTQTLKVK
ncbi:MAG: InlB B-repeat-containing protein [Propionibacteriaceae bacterium]|jgi:uncharacterized repeat protein (TIGR02543 family)|nr:InlB B-repeat-containing protein [Propionibacteriaceae bacterium]